MDREQRLLSALLHDVAALHLGTEKVSVQAGSEMNRIFVSVHYKGKVVEGVFRGSTQQDLLRATRDGFRALLEKHWPREYVGSLP